MIVRNETIDGGSSDRDRGEDHLWSAWPGVQFEVSVAPPRPPPQLDRPVRWRGLTGLELQ